MNIALLAQGLLSMIKVLPIWFDVLWTRKCHIAKRLVVSTYILFRQRKSYHFSQFDNDVHYIHVVTSTIHDEYHTYIHVPLGADAALLLCKGTGGGTCSPEKSLWRGTIPVTITSLWCALASSETRSIFIIDEACCNCAHSPLGGLLERFFGIAPVATEIKKGLISWAQQ